MTLEEIARYPKVRARRRILDSPLAREPDVVARGEVGHIESIDWDRETALVTFGDCTVVCDASELAPVGVPPLGLDALARLAG